MSDDTKPAEKELPAPHSLTIQQYVDLLRQYPPAEVPDEDIKEISLALNSILNEAQDEGVAMAVTTHLEDASDHISSASRLVKTGEDRLLEHPKVFPELASWVRKATKSLELALVENEIILASQQQSAIEKSEKKDEADVQDEVDEPGKTS